MLSPLRTTLYKAVVRELEASPKSSSNAEVKEHLQQFFESNRTDSLERVAEDMKTFIKASRLHKELFERYHPKDDQSVTERVRQTARRVGLDVPIEPKS